MIDMTPDGFAIPISISSEHGRLHGRLALQPGARVAVEFVERQPGEWVITSATPVGKAAAPAANPHAGH